MMEGVILQAVRSIEQIHPDARERSLEALSVSGVQAANRAL